METGEEHISIFLCTTPPLDACLEEHPVGAAAAASTERGKESVNQNLLRRCSFNPKSSKFQRPRENAQEHNQTTSDERGTFFSPHRRRVSSLLMDSQLINWGLIKWTVSGVFVGRLEFRDRRVQSEDVSLNYIYLTPSRMAGNA